MIPHHRFGTRLTVRRLTSTTDDGGGQSTVLEDVGEVKGQVSQPSADEQRTAQQEGANLTHVVHMSPDADVRRNDVLVTGDGVELRVWATFKPSQPRYLRANCETTQTGA